MKKEAKVLLAKSIDSLFLAVEHFNRPWDRGRPEVVLVLLDRSFELLLKAVIVHRGGKIRERRAKETIGFDSCVRKCVSDPRLKCLSEEEAITIQVINSLRDAAQHYLLEISEQQLYIYTQGGLTLYNTVLETVFREPLKKHLPNRVLPPSTDPPKDLGTVITAEFRDIKSLLAPGSRKRLDAQARLRTLQIVEESLGGSCSQPGEPELRRLAKEISKGKSWQAIFPGLASLQLDTTGSGLSVSLRITKHEGEPIRLVPEGTPGATVVAIKRVNELSYYSLGLHDLAKKLGLTNSKMLAVVKALKVQSNSDYFRVFIIGKVMHKRYSIKCLDYLHKELPSLDIDRIWKSYGPGKSGNSESQPLTAAHRQ
jgi:hypothetical protein